MILVIGIGCIQTTQQFQLFETGFVPRNQAKVIQNYPKSIAIPNLHNFVVPNNLNGNFLFLLGLVSSSDHIRKNTLTSKAIHRVTTIEKLAGTNTYKNKSLNKNIDNKTKYTYDSILQRHPSCH